MNFEKVLKELKAGKRIRRKEWEAFQFMVLKEGSNDVITFKGEYTNYYGSNNLFLDPEWHIYEDDEKLLSFPEIIEALKAKQRVRNRKWPNKDTFIFLDHHQLAVCRPVQFDFSPSWEDLIATDWETMK